ncbi:hypothetical protein KUTeg_014083 [Tegillarca granosa]|uniref:FERM domain-containing protein 8 n=1 Tax=Tegillarca granosa TaxID=220873 RepID=A0ABQ9EVZ0_TEGGR|nr:hypothetical protein KUTeg_014083 [Tegillarca granosa]
MAESDRKPLHRDEEAAAETSYLVSHDEDAVEVVIWLRDRKGIHVNLEGQGHLAEAADLFEIIVSHRGLPKDSHNIFSLWLVSPLLELRLKDKHKPFHFAQLWDEFCAMYTDAKAEEISRDEPVVMFQRNVFLSLEDEMRISNDSALALLYYEAKYNVIEGRYVMNREDYDELAGIQALIQYRFYTEGEHTEEHYKKDIKMFYPAHLYKPSKPSIIPGAKKNKELRLEESLAASHKAISRQYEEEDYEEILPTLFLRYLKTCWKYPFYGSYIV